MKEDNTFTPVEPVQPIQPQPITSDILAQPVEPIQPVVQEPIQPVMQTPVESTIQTPVEPQPVIQDVNYNPQPPKKKNPFRTVAIVLVTAAVIGGGGYFGYKFFNKPTNDKNENTTETTTTTTETTTTSTTTKVVEVAANNISEYAELVEPNISNNLFHFTLPLDNSFVLVETNTDKLCNKLNENLSFTLKNGIKMNYTCAPDEEDLPEQIVVTGKIDDKYDFKTKKITTCGSTEYYVSKIGYLQELFPCQGSEIGLKYESNGNTKKIYNALHNVQYKGESKKVYPFIKNNRLYYVRPTIDVPEDQYTYKSQYCDFREMNLETLEEKVIENFECNYEKYDD